MSTTEHRQLTSSDVEEAAHVIGGAFIDDPLFTFMLPVERTRQRTLVKFFRAYGAVGVRNDLMFGFGDPLQGVAYWNAPGRPNVSISVKALGKFAPLLFTRYPMGLFRARAITKRIDDLHGRHVPAEHFYLDNIGVARSARGQGVSSKLIRPFLAMADAAGVAVYTDTVTAANVPLYEHFGLRCVEESPVVGTGITVYALYRAPR